MPEYLAPGVYVEEVSYRAKSIEGVSTSTAGFVGPARYGPISGVPTLVTSFAEFERIFGGLDQLEFDEGGEITTNFLAHGVRAFFDNGGKRLYISRVFQKEDATGKDISAQGYARVHIDEGNSRLTLRARHPGQAGNLRVSITARLGQNVKVGAGATASLKGVSDNDLVWVGPATQGSFPSSGELYRAERRFDSVAERVTWRLHPETGAARALDQLSAGDAVRVLTVNVDVSDPFDPRRSEYWENLALVPEHPRSLHTVFAADPTSRMMAVGVPIVFEMTPDDLEGPAIARILLDAVLDRVPDEEATDAQRRRTFVLEGGDDGDRPRAEAYEGSEADPKAKTGLRAFEDIVDISIVAAPGYSFGGNNGYGKNAMAIMGHLISHAERMRYRIAVLDPPQQVSIPEIRAWRAQVDSTHAALYYPWIQVLDPVTNQELGLPPSGFMAGIYARNDIEKGVHKAPANEVVRGALGFEFLLNKSQQDVLNPEGINCFRFFEGRGNRVWGARTISSDPEWKYVNLRRYFAFLERSIERGTQWAVFENNGPILWENIKRTVDDFLFNEWKSGHLFGDKPNEAYFVKCDRSTMSQNDFDNGRLICLIGVSPLRPAEFVIFRIGQWTANAQR